MNRPRVVVIGGGTGTFVALTGLKNYPLDLSVIVSMMDSGGSNRIIRDEFGLLPTSDIRQCITALASNRSLDLLRQLFTYPYSAGIGISGMTFGNLFMAALTDLLGSQKAAIAATCELLGVEGKILPITYDNSQLLAKYASGLQLLGEHQIDEPPPGITSRLISLKTIPPATADPDAINALNTADFIVFAPGDFYTSLISNLVVKKVAAAFKSTPAKLIFVLNLMTKYGQTTGFKASDFIKDLTRYLGGRQPDYCLVHYPLRLPPSLLARYRKESSIPVVNDLTPANFSGRVITADLISSHRYAAHRADPLRRSYIRHDSQKLAAALWKIINPAH